MSVPTSDRNRRGGGRPFDPNRQEDRDYAQRTNRDWVNDVRRPDGLIKASQIHQDQLEAYLRETAVFDKILPPQEIDPSECEVGHNVDRLFKKLWFQIPGGAYVGDFGAKAQEVREVFVPRIFMGFTVLQSPTYVVNEHNLPAYPFPITQQVEDNIGVDLGEAKDWCMHFGLEGLLQASRTKLGNVMRGVQAKADIAANKARNGGGVHAAPTTAFRGQIERQDFTTLKSYFAGKRSRLSMVLLPEINAIQMESWDAADVGDQLLGEIAINGYNYDQVHGVKFIRTIKCDSSQGDTFREGNIYAFASANEVGRNYTLRGLKFWMERDRQFLSFDAQLVFGFLWAVSSKVCKLELYNGGLRLNNTTVVDLQTSGADGFVSVPGSDEIWGDPQYVTSKDYYNLSDAFHRPATNFV